MRHVGSARDEAGLGLLMDQARELLAGDLQRELDLGLAAPVAYAGLLGPPDRALVGVPARRRRRAVPASGVVRTFSGVLYGALTGVYASLGFDGLGDEVFRDLVIARIVEPTSLSGVDRVLADLGRVAPSLSSRKRTLKRCYGGGYRARLAGLCHRHASGHGDLSLVLYDLTTLRTQADKEDGFRKVGYSKDRSVDPQVTVGLLVDRGGFPLRIDGFPGNQAEKHTLLPMIEAFTAAHGGERPVIVADAGMLSADNLKALDDAGHRFIVGSRMTKAPADLASHFRWHGDAFTDGQTIDTITPKTGPNRENDPALKAEPVWDPHTHPGSWRAVWAYTTSRFVHDNTTLTAQENRAKAVIAGDAARRAPRFVKTTPGGLALDTASIARARRLAGLKGYATNIPATLMAPEEVIARYHDLWHVEQSFRIFKSDLGARPFFSRKQDAIQAHLTIVFAALAITRTIQHRTGHTIRHVLHALRPLRSATIHTNGITRTLPPIIGHDEQAILDTINHPPPRH